MSDFPIVVIADDLSGAAELAGIAFAHGLSAEVQTQWHQATGAQVIALDTDTRGVPAQEAAARVHHVAQQISAVQPRLLFKKVDSVLRGNVRSEIEAILSATGQSHAVLAPANPSRGRVIQAGRYLVGGVPLHQTDFASDPDYPRHSADIATLLGGTSDRISVPDINTSADLEHIARSIDDSTLAAGAADFFAAILAHRGHSPHAAPPTELPLSAPALLICGSFAAWTNRKSECEAAKLTVVVPNHAGPACRAVAVEQLQARGNLVLGVGDFVAPSEQRHAAFASFTTAAAEHIRRCQPATILAEGGATAAALACHLAWTRMTVAITAPSGIGVLRPLGSSDAPLIVIKPGSYPWPSAIWRLFCALRG
jgi:D-threonate/D-erythronate kinase